MDSAPVLSPGRLARLRLLAGGPAARARNNIGFFCALAGWTEWDYRHPGTDLPISFAAAKLEFGNTWFRDMKPPINERLTDAGRDVLQAIDADRDEAEAGSALNPDVSEWIDKPLPEDDAIMRAHPINTGRHDIFLEAMRLVGARHSKSSLVSLVNWLLAERAAARRAVADD